MKKIAVIGANGMLGYAIRSYFGRQGYRVVALTRKEFDIARDPIDKLIPLLEGAAAVINCAGVIKPTIAKNTVEDVMRINAIFPRNLARLCDAGGIQCFHVTTDCVYSGKKGNYTERDFFDAEDLYGLSKNAGETADAMVLRTSIIGEEQGEGRSLLEWVKSQAGKSVNGFTNHRWNGVTTLHLAELIDKIITLGSYRKGIFHVHLPKAVTKYELVSIINEVYELDLNVVPTEAEEVIDRSLSSIFNLSKRLCIKTVRQQVEEMREFFLTSLVEPHAEFKHIIEEQQ